MQPVASLSGLFALANLERKGSYDELKSHAIELNLFSMRSKPGSIFIKTYQNLMTEKHVASYEFGPYRLFPSERLLLREGKLVSLTPKVFAISIARVFTP
jgi:hypothetical protein